MHKFAIQGEAFRKARKQFTNYNLEEVATKMNRTKAWLSDIENGKKNVYFGDAKKLCNIYGCTVDDISHMIDELSR